MIPLANRKILIRFILIGLAVTMYDVMLHSLLTVMHLAFEWFEFALEHLIEHIFHTTRQQSQIIVFYLLCLIGFSLLYCLWRALPGLYNRLKIRLLAAGSQFKPCIAGYWRALSLMQKTKWLASFTVSISLAFLVFS
jgi:hypothetical protein